jgi:hypothetical protein
MSQQMDLAYFMEIYNNNRELFDKLAEDTREKQLKIKNDQKKEKVQEYLKNKIPLFNENPEIFNDLENPEKSTFLIAGLVQSGKSNVICGLSLYLNQVLNLNVINVVRDIRADYEQLYRKYIRDFSEYPLVINYTGEDSISKIFMERQPSITISLEHQNHFEKIQQAYALNPESNFVLIADECDLICYKDEKSIEPIRIQLFNEIKNRSKKFIGITATAFDMLYMEHRLTCDNIYTLPVPTDYKGVDHSDFKINELDKKFDFKLGKTADPAIWRFSKDMESFYTDIMDTPVFEEKTEEGSVIHPVMCLQTTETEKTKQLQCLGAFARHSVFKEEFTVVVYNGDGVFMYSPDGIDRDIVVKTQDGKEKLHKAKFDASAFFKYCDGVAYFKHLNLGDALQYLKNRRDPPTHIVIIAGLMVGRGLNIVSTDFKWHLTHQILKTSDTATCSDVLQKCRCFGIYRDKIPINLYCLQKDAISIKQSLKLQNRLFEGAEIEEVVKNMPELCEEIKIYVGNIPKRRTTKKCKEPQWNKVAKEQEQYGEVMEEEKNLGIYRVLPERLTQVRRNYYDRIVDYLEQSGQKNKWLKKSKVIKEITQDKQEVDIITSSLWNWVGQNSQCNEAAEIQNESGLLLKQNGHEWYIRLN